MPFSAPLPVPAMMATGVARPRAQGQEITSTDTPEVSAKAKICADDQPYKECDQGDGHDNGHENTG